MSPLTAVLFTIPISIREQLQIEPGYTEVAYDLDGSSLRQPICTIILNPIKSLFGKTPVTYKVSSKGQIRVPSEILDHLGLYHKDELDIELRGDHLQLIRGRFYQFRDLINEMRPNFFTDTDSETDCLTVAIHDHPDEGAGRLLRVNKSTFSLLKALFPLIKAKYEPLNPKPWVGIPLDPEGSIEDADLSLFFNEHEQTITIQKLGPSFLPGILGGLWRDRNAFTLMGDTLSYFENGKPIVEKIAFSKREVTGMFNRNGRVFTQYRTAGGFTVETIELYNGDQVVLEHRGTYALHYWPKIK